MFITITQWPELFEITWEIKVYTQVRRCEGNISRNQTISILVKTKLPKPITALLGISYVLKLNDGS